MPLFYNIRLEMSIERNTDRGIALSVLRALPSGISSAGKSLGGALPRALSRGKTFLGKTKARGLRLKEQRAGPEPAPLPGEPRIKAAALICASRRLTLPVKSYIIGAYGQKSALKIKRYNIWK